MVVQQTVTVYPGGDTTHTHFRFKNIKGEAQHWRDERAAGKYSGVFEA